VCGGVGCLVVFVVLRCERAELPGDPSSPVFRCCVVHVFSVVSPLFTIVSSGNDDWVKYGWSFSEGFELLVSLCP